MVPDTDKITSKIAGPKSNFHAVIEVPRKTDLRVRMMAGDLHVGEVEGNKDIEMLRRQSGAELDSSAGLRKGRFFRPRRRRECAHLQSSKERLVALLQDLWPGQIPLHAHVGVGDLTLQTNTI